MALVSYAQNYEDIMLWRALKHVNNGFYIDVGANDPEEDSVTKLFYDRGWHGINIEPLSQHIQALNIQRTLDINLQCAISNETGSISLWDSDVRGWASASPLTIQNHVDAGIKGQMLQVEARTLASVISQHAPKNIHFLKVDVEGLEYAVIQSNNWQQYRPWIVVIEATLPDSQVENHQEWENLLLASNYSFAYADGLNRFYIAQEHMELATALTYPPNIFDGFIKASEHRLAKQLLDLYEEQNLNQIAPQLSPVLARIEQTLNDSQKSLQVLEKHLSQTQSSLFETQNKMNENYISLTQTEHKLNNLETEYAQLQTANHTLLQQHQELNNNCHHWFIQAKNANEQIDQIFKSRSWRITSPLRGVVNGFRQIKKHLRTAVKWTLKKSMSLVFRHPKLKNKILNWVYDKPILKQRLKDFAINQGLISRPPAQNEATGNYSISENEQLSQRAKQILKKIKPS